VKQRYHDNRHGLNRDGPGATKKRGGNKGIAAARKAQKREEAEARNARTLPQNRRSFRRLEQAA
jgi:hypothetical protein